MIILDGYFINGICCNLCIKHDTHNCPIKTVWRNWNHETDYCGKFQSRKTADTIIDVMSNRVRGYSVV